MFSTYFSGNSSDISPLSFWRFGGPVGPRAGFGPRFDAIELVLPEFLVGQDPIMDRFETLAIDPIEPAAPLVADADQPDLAQHTEVLRHLRLGPLQGRDDIVHRPLAIDQNTQHAAALRLGDGVEHID